METITINMLFINPATFVFTFNPLKIKELHQIFIVYLIAGLIMRQ